MNMKTGTIKDTDVSDGSVIDKLNGCNTNSNDNNNNNGNNNSYDNSNNN